MEDIQISTKSIEKSFSIKIKDNWTSIGLDTASKTGYCVAFSNAGMVNLNFGVFNINVQGVKDKKTRRRIFARHIYDNLTNLFSEIVDKVIIEDVYHGVNAHTTILLSRIGGIAYGVARRYVSNPEDIDWRTAAEARKALGLKGTGKKPEIMKAVNEVLGLNIKNDNIVDAIVLALNGLIDE